MGVSKLHKAASGLVWQDTFDPNTRAAGTSLHEYDMNTPSVFTVSSLGYLAVTADASGPVIWRNSVTVDPYMVVEVDGWVSGTVGSRLLSILIDKSPAGLSEVDSYLGFDSASAPDQDISRYRAGVQASLATRTPAVLGDATWYTFRFSRLTSGTSNAALRFVRSGEPALTHTDTSPLWSGPFGFGLYIAQSSGGGRWRNLVVFKSNTITVSGLATNNYAEITDINNANLAGATESGGTASIDVSTITHRPLGIIGKLRVWTTSAKATLIAERGSVFNQQVIIGGGWGKPRTRMVRVGTDAFWGGDEYRLLVQPVHNPAFTVP